MNEMLKGLIENLKDKFKKEDLTAILEIENELKLEEFNSDIALEIGRNIVACSKKYGEDLIVKITRLKDDEIVFQYIGDKKATRNLVFADMKTKAAKLSSHSSLYTLAEIIIEGAYKDDLESDDILPVGGAFPIYVNDEIAAYIGVSGMHNGLDHVVIVEGLAKYLNKSVKEYKGGLY